MEVERPSELRFLPLAVRGYLAGTAISALALHIAISFIAPGDAGTSQALGDGAILFAIAVVLALYGIIAFPLAALGSWPVRGLVSSHPLLAAILAGAMGLVLGIFCTSFLDLRVGPGDFWSAPLVGFVYAIVWFSIVRRAALKTSGDHA